MGFWAWGAVALLATTLLLAGFGSLNGAQASTVTSFTATADTYAAGASAVQYTVGFTATSALAADTGYVQLTAPAGSTLSTSTANFSVTVTGTSPSGPTKAFNVTAGGSSNVVDVYVPSAVAAGDGVQIDAYESSNPASANPAATFSMSTSSNTSTAGPVAFAITGPTAVSGVSASSTAPTAGSTEVQDTVTFTADQEVVYADNDTFPTQCLDGMCNQGAITLTAPMGTKFDSYDQDYTVKDLTSGMTDAYEAGESVGPANVVRVDPTFTIDAGDRVQVSAYEVENPSSAVPSGTISVSTTSDTTPTSTSFPIGASVAVTSGVVAVTSTTGGAADTDYLIGLTTTQALTFWNGGSDGTGYVVLTYPAGTNATGLDRSDTALVSDAEHPTPVPATGVGQYGTNFSDNFVDVAMPFAVPAGTALTITLAGATNPATFSYPSISTTSDAAPTPDAGPTGVTATAGSISAGVSWTALAAPFGATLTDSLVTPFAGAAAQTPYDTHSNASSATVPGLTNGNAYTFEVQEIYADGSTTYDGPPSAASNSVTPSGMLAPPGTAEAAFSSPLSFGTEFTGQSTAAQTVTLYDTGSLALQVSAVSLTGAGAGSFTIAADTCTGTTVPAAGSCAVSVVFAPTVSAAVSASLSFSDNASGSPQTVALTGTGTNVGYVSGLLYASNEVNDPGLAGVVVVMCQVGTQTCFSGDSDSAGHYTVGPLPPGQYSVSVTGGTFAINSISTPGYTVVTGLQTHDIGVIAPQLFPTSVSLIGTDLGPEGFVEAGYPLALQFSPSFPAEPAGTQLAYLTTSAVTSLYATPIETYTTGAVVLIVSYGANGTPTVIAQYPDTSSGTSPKLTLSTASPGASTSDGTSSGILDQYLPSGQLQATVPPMAHVLWTKITNESCYAVVSKTNTAVHVHAVGLEIAIGAVAPTLAGAACTPLPDAGVSGDAYFDPSGKVQSTTGIPLQSATVTLLTAQSAAGPFTAVPNGSAIMSPQNRKNPDRTNALGSFGWDTVPAYYRVTAAHPGCTAPGGHGKLAQTPVYDVPPPVDGITIKLKCLHLKRARSHVRLKIATKHGMSAVTATISGRHPVGAITFTAHGLHAVLPLTGKDQAEVVLPRSRESVSASYAGDANNAPSRAHAHSH